MGISIQDIGAIGELIGAIAVVATLIYLSSQIRQNTTAVKATSLESVFNTTSEVWRNWCNDFERTEKFFEIAAKKTRSPAERQFHLGFIMLTIRAQENMYFHLKLGTVDADFVRLESRLKAIFEHPQSIYKDAWDEGHLQAYLSNEFRQYVEGVRANLQTLQMPSQPDETLSNQSI